MLLSNEASSLQGQARAAEMRAVNRDGVQKSSLLADAIVVVQKGTCREPAADLDIKVSTS